MEKRAIPSLKGMRPSADATAILNRGGADRLNEHDTPNGDCVSRVYSVGTFARCGAPVRGGLRGYGFIHIARMRSFQICLYACYSRHIGVFGNRHNFAPRGA